MEPITIWYMGERSWVASNTTWHVGGGVCALALASDTDLYTTNFMHKSRSAEKTTKCNCPRLSAISHLTYLSTCLLAFLIGLLRSTSFLGEIFFEPIYDLACCIGILIGRKHRELQKLKFFLLICYPISFSSRTTD